MKIVLITSKCLKWYPISWAWMRSQVTDLTTERNFDSQATLAIDVLGLYYLTCHNYGRLYHQPLADIRSTAASIGCLYCNKCLSNEGAHIIVCNSSWHLPGKPKLMATLLALEEKGDVWICLWIPCISNITWSSLDHVGSAQAPPLFFFHLE